MTLTAYSNKNVKWDLTLNGTTPSELTLVDISIEYPGTEDPIEDVMYLPKFTFTFLGTKELYDGFGEITWNSHPFELVSDSGYKWLGYLTPDVFSMPNTGYREEFSMNGISQVETLKYIPYASVKETMIRMDEEIKSILQKNTKISGLVTSMGDPMFTAWINQQCFCMNDDDMDEISMLDVLEWCASSLGWRFILEWDNIVYVYGLPSLFAAGGADYSQLKHAGIEESFDAGKTYDSVTVECKEARPEYVNVDFKLPDDRLKQHYIEVKQGIEKGVGHKTEDFIGYMRYLGYFKKDQFDGWSFPKYNASGAIEEWWNPDAIFDSDDVPVMGAYPMVYRQDSGSWTKAMVVIGQLYDQRASRNLPYAVYQKKFIPNKGDYICFDGSVICSFFSIENSDKWPVFASRKPFQTKRNPGELWTQCPVPILLRKGDEGNKGAWDTLESMYWLYASVKFGDEYWNPAIKAWVKSATPVRFDIADITDVGRNGHGNDNAFQVPWEIEKKIDTTGEMDKYFEKVTGYWIELPAKYGELIISFYFPTWKDRSSIYIPTLFLPEFKISKVNIYNDSEYVDRANKAYRGGRNEGTAAHSSKNYSVYLSSYKDDLFETFLSTLSWNKEGTVPVTDNVPYSYPLPQGGSVTFTERPEYHIIRISLYYISGMKKISDILNIADRRLTFRYGNEKLWENGCAIYPLRDTAEVTYSYNRTDYGG